VPTVAQRNGIISSTTAINDPLRPGVSYPSVGGLVTIPQDRIDPSARAILALIPLPNEGTNQFRRVSPVGANFRQEIVRFDHNFTDTTTFNARYIRDNFTRDDPGGNIFIDPFVRTNIAGTIYPFVPRSRPTRPAIASSPRSVRPLADLHQRDCLRLRAQCH
jgi:hypothetical protein